MSFAVCLLVYAVLVGVAAPRLLPHLARDGRAPHAAVVAWVIVMASVTVSWVTAAIGLAVDAARSWQRPDLMALSACLARLLSVWGGTGLAVQTAVATTALVLAAVAAVRVCRVLIGARACGRRHADTARVVGRRVTGIDGVVIEASEKLVYCVGGRSGVVVVTTAALAALPGRTLDAVLAHERAHADRGHHGLLALTRALSITLPRLRLFTAAHLEIARLVEMCADDVAARRHGAQALLSAMSALAGCGPLPAGALGATGIGVADRVVRLAQPHTTTQRWCTRAILAVCAGAVVATPVWGAVSGVGACILFAI